MRLRVVLLALALLATPPTFAVAQITAATISGTIKDQTGGVLAGVDVVVRNLDTGLTRSAITDSNGSFTVPGLAPGKYESRATLQGFTAAVQRGIVLEVAQQAGLNLMLKVGTTSEMITVTGESPVVDTRTSALSAVVPEKTIEELPLNGRHYINLATLQPGIISFTEKSGTAPATRGMQLNINGNGRAMGGVVSIATKSGSNELHASAFEFFRDSKMDAPNAAVRPYLDLYPLPNGRDLGPGIGQYTYESTRITRESFLQGRIDVELSDKDQLFVRYTYDESNQVNPQSTGRIQDTGFAQFFTRGTSGNHFLTAEEKRTFSPSLLNSARFSTSVLTYEQYPDNTLSQPLSFFPEAPFMGTILVGGLSQIGNDNISPSSHLTRSRVEGSDT